MPRAIRKIKNAVKRAANSRVGRGVAGAVRAELSRQIPLHLKPHVRTLTNQLKRSISGRGDYQYNGLINPRRSAVPSFGSTSTSFRRRELIGTVVSSSTVGAFKLDKFTLNPALARTCPWLSGITNNYESWLPKSMVFEYKSTSGMSTSSGDTSLGVVVMACQYNVFASDPSNRVQLEGMNRAVSIAPYENGMFGVECQRGNRQSDSLLLRNSSMASAPSSGAATLYDLGEFFIATQGFQTASVVAGELWVTYDIDLKNQIVPTRSAIPQSLALYGRGGDSSVWFMNDGEHPLSIEDGNSQLPSIFREFLGNEAGVVLQNLEAGAHYQVLVYWPTQNAKNASNQLTIEAGTGLEFAEEGWANVPTGSNTNKGWMSVCVFHANDSPTGRWTFSVFADGEQLATSIDAIITVSPVNSLNDCSYVMHS